MNGSLPVVKLKKGGFSPWIGYNKKKWDLPPIFGKNFYKYLYNFNRRRKAMKKSTKKGFNKPFTKKYFFEYCLTGYRP